MLDVWMCAAKRCGHLKYMREPRRLKESLEAR